MCRAGWIVTEPGSRKIAGSARMALLASIQQVLLDDRAVRAGYLKNVMNAVAVNAHRFIRFLSRRYCLEHLYRCAMEIRQVGVEYLGVDAIFRHQLRIRMATCADIR